MQHDSVTKSDRILNIPSNLSCESSPLFLNWSHLSCASCGQCSFGTGPRLARVTVPKTCGLAAPSVSFIGFQQIPRLRGVVPDDREANLREVAAQGPSHFHADRRQGILHGRNRSSRLPTEPLWLFGKGSFELNCLVETGRICSIAPTKS